MTQQQSTHPTAVADDALRDLPPPQPPVPTWPPEPTWSPAPTWPPGPPSGPRHHPRATAAFAVGLTALIGIVFVVPAVLGPLACYLGVSARREIEREPLRFGGRGQATAGVTLGIIASVLLLIVVLMMLAAAGMFALALNIDTGYGL